MFSLPQIEHLEELRDGLKALEIQFACSVMPKTVTREKVPWPGEWAVLRGASEWRAAKSTFGR